MMVCKHCHRVIGKRIWKEEAERFMDEHGKFVSGHVTVVVCEYCWKAGSR